MTHAAVAEEAQLVGQVLTNQPLIPFLHPGLNVSYLSRKVPYTYFCRVCGKIEVKLWIFGHNLCCAECATSIQGLEFVSKPNYKITDKIGDFTPAILTKRNDAFYGFDSVPTVAANWWRNLPSYKGKVKR